MFVIEYFVRVPNGSAICKWAVLNSYDIKKERQKAAPGRQKGEEIMVSKNLIVVNPSGLHLRPAGVLAQTSMKFKSDIIIECGEKRIVAKSVLNVMASGIRCGTEVEVCCDGKDEEEALEAVCTLIETGLKE